MWAVDGWAVALPEAIERGVDPITCLTSPVPPPPTPRLTLFEESAPAACAPIWALKAALVCVCVCVCEFAKYPIPKPCP